ncbi:MAG: LPS export ABC transporter periplasmic protein LptC [Tannerella sp.]|jgi:LPS export ABC transporter protein LptC|nr:LPS export ABC transporter periplasmic protein LptC [Tannerella sp.]
MAIVLVAIVMPFYFFASCTEEKKEMVEVIFDPETSYTLKETNVETLVSDSGITRYKVITDTWLIFDKASEPYWYFPDSVYLEKFDTVFNVETSIRADTAHYYKRRNLWQLDGHVDIRNMDSVRLETSQLFLDENKKIFYSDSFVVITKGETVNTGIGFLSNEDMSEYEIFDSTADFTVETQRRGQETDSIPTDSTDLLPNRLPSDMEEKE